VFPALYCNLQRANFLHFHPDCKISVEEDKIKVDSEITITFKNHRYLIVQEYNFSWDIIELKKLVKSEF
jgi:hypothetical protein